MIPGSIGSGRVSEIASSSGAGRSAAATRWSCRNAMMRSEKYLHASTEGSVLIGPTDEVNMSRIGMRLGANFRGRHFACMQMDSSLHMYSRYPENDSCRVQTGARTGDPDSWGG